MDVGSVAVRRSCRICRERHRLCVDDVLPNDEYLTHILVKTNRRTVLAAPVSLT